MSDLVGSVVGGNSTTGGQNTTFLKSHSSYTGSLPSILSADGKDNPVRQLTDDAWGDGKINQPVKITPSRKEGDAQ